MAEREQRIRDGARRQTSFNPFSKLLEAIDARVGQIKDTGEDTSRTEVLSMLIFEFVNSEPSQDSTRLRRFRTATEFELPNSDPPKTT